MAMAGRHIRWDWQQFVPWEQKSVRTLCGKTSTFNATGIPGVTEQPEVVEVSGRKVFGWCTMCSVSAYRTAGNALMSDSAPEIHPYIVPMYQGLYDIVRPVFDAYATRQRSWRRV